MRLVFVTQQVDPGDPILGATVAKLRALAERCDELVVLSLGRGVAHDLPANVTLRTFGASTRLRRGLRYERVLAPVLAGRPDGLIAHMCPIYLVLAAPLAKPFDGDVRPSASSRSGPLAAGASPRAANCSTSMPWPSACTLGESSG